MVSALAPRVELNKTGGWAGFSNSNTGAAPALGIVFGLDSDPLPDPSVGASWYRWGYAGGSFSAEETTWRNYFVSSNVRRYRVGQGEGVWSRYYFVLGGDLTDLAARIAARSLVGVELREFDYDESSSPLVGVPLQRQWCGLPDCCRQRVAALPALCTSGPTQLSDLRGAGARMAGAF